MKASASNENGGWPEHVHVQIIVDMLDLSGDSVAPRRRDSWERDSEQTKKKKTKTKTSCLQHR
jgi:hypothetical protein